MNIWSFWSLLPTHYPPVLRLSNHFRSFAAKTVHIVNQNRTKCQYRSAEQSYLSSSLPPDTAHLTLISPAPNTHIL